MDRDKIIQILTKALGGEDAEITIKHKENCQNSHIITTGTGREVAENLAAWLVD